MMWRNPLAYRQNSAQAPSCGAMGFAGLPGLRHDAFAAVAAHPRRSVRTQSDPSPSLVPAPFRGGRLFPADRQGSAEGCNFARLTFSRAADAVESGFTKSLKEGRAKCVFNFFSLQSQWQAPSPVARKAVMVSRACCKPRVAVLSPVRSSAQPSQMPPMKTWWPAPRWARWRVAHPAACRACRAATDLLTAAFAARRSITEATGARRPGGFFRFANDGTRRPAWCRGKGAACSRRS